ncbi:MAG: hypothetical protein JKX91_06535 [Rhizobiaceae bacterium]|nr:hypothetical protein [Rhizobiaceae bacterium]
MDSLDNTKDQLAFLKAKRTEDSQQSEQPEEGLEQEETVEELEVEAEPNEEAEETVQQEGEEEELDGVYMIDGEEVTLTQIQDWKRGNLRESDYTRKTQDLATQRKVFEAKEAKISNREEKLNSLIDNLEQSIGDQESSVDWDELMEDDPSQYLKLKAKIEKKQKSLDSAKADKDKATDDKKQLHLQEQRALIPKLLPEWMDSKGGATDQMNEDLKVISDYLGKNGFSDQEMNEIVDAKLWPVYLDAARFRALSDKKPAISKRVKNAPKVIKPTKSRSKPSDTSVVDEATNRFRNSGSDKDGLAYLKAKRAR